MTDQFFGFGYDFGYSQKSEPFSVLVETGKPGFGRPLLLVLFIMKRCSGISGKLKSNVDFHCRRCLEGENGLFQSVLLKEVVIEPNVKLECVPKFCYLGDTLGAGGVEAARARVRIKCAWAKFRELSPILTARGASYHIKRKIYKACVQSALT